MGHTNAQDLKLDEVHLHVHALFDSEHQNKPFKIYVFVGDREDSPSLTCPKVSHYTQLAASKVVKYRTGMNNIVLKIDGHEPVSIDLASLRPNRVHKVWVDFVHTKDRTDLEFQLSVFSKSQATPPNIFREAMERKPSTLIDIFNEDKDNQTAVRDAFTASLHAE